MWNSHSIRDALWSSETRVMRARVPVPDWHLPAKKMVLLEEWGDVKEPTTRSAVRRAL